MLDILIEIPLDRLLRCLLEFVNLQFDLAQFAERRKQGVELLAVLFHNIGQVFVGESKAVGLIIVGMDKADEFLALLYDQTLIDHRHGVELVLNLFRINILTVRAKQHVLRTSA